MILLGKIICGGIGATIGGPIGALIGAVVGHVLFDSAKLQLGEEKRTKIDQTQIAFFTCFFACLAKIMKADGLVTKDEVDCLKKMIDIEFQLDPESRKFALEIIKKAKDDNVSAFAYIEQLSKIINYNNDLGMTFVVAIHKLAMADNILHPMEEKILYFSEKAFRLKPGTVNTLLEKSGDKVTSDLKKSYEILGCNAGMTNSEIKKAYRAKCLEFHPDRIVSKGLPEEFIKFSNEQMGKIHDAYKTVIKVNSK